MFLNVCPEGVTGNRKHLAKALNSSIPWAAAAEEILQRNVRDMICLNKITSRVLVAGVALIGQQQRHEGGFNHQFMPHKPAAVRFNNSTSGGQENPRQCCPCVRLSSRVYRPSTSCSLSWVAWGLCVPSWLSTAWRSSSCWPGGGPAYGPCGPPQGTPPLRRDDKGQGCLNLGETISIFKTSMNFDAIPTDSQNSFTVLQCYWS